MKKIDNTQPALKSFEEVNGCLLTIAVMTLNADKKETKMNQELLAVKQKYEPDITELRNKISDQEEALEEFCKKNKKEFAETRSRQLSYGRIGFRSGKNKLALISKKFTWTYFTEKIQALFGVKYVKITVKLDKAKILSDFEKKLISEEQISSAGGKLVRGESSFYEINYDSVHLVEEKE